MVVSDDVLVGMHVREAVVLMHVRVDEVNGEQEIGIAEDFPGRFVRNEAMLFV
jgi:hypothetical protein